MVPIHTYLITHSEVIDESFLRVMPRSSTDKPAETRGRPRSFYERRYGAAARIYTGDKANMTRQNNEQIVEYIDLVYPIPRGFTPPAGLKARDLKVDVGELNIEDLGKRYWLVWEIPPIDVQY